MNVIGNKTISRALREERHKCNKEQTLSVPGRLDKECPAITCILLFQFDCILDLLELPFTKGVIAVAVTVILYPIH
jgi:hypothetical protein